MTNESPYGHDHVILDRLLEWVQATDPYTIPEPDAEDPLALVNATRALNSAIIDAVPYAEHVPEDLRSRAYNIRAHIRDLSAQFLFHEYTDSNTDEPCDVEFNVTGLVAELVPGYKRSDEIQPSYVGPIYYPTPEDEEDIRANSNSRSE